MALLSLAVVLTLFATGGLPTKPLIPIDEGP